MDILDRRINIQQKAIACQSKALSHMLQMELYTMGNSVLIRREGEMSTSSNQSFPSNRGNSNYRGGKVIFDPITGAEGVVTPPPNDYSINPPVGGLQLVQERLTKRKMLKQRTKHYYQWLHSTIQDKAKISQISCNLVRIQGPPKRPSSGLLRPVSTEQECNRKGRKHQVSWVLQFSCFWSPSPTKSGDRS